MNLPVLEFFHSIVRVSCMFGPFDATAFLLFFPRNSFVINDDTGGLVIFNSRVLIKINRMESSRVDSFSATAGPFSVHVGNIDPTKYRSSIQSALMELILFPRIINLCFNRVSLLLLLLFLFFSQFVTN